jgi:hypothetical protein
MLDLDAIPEQPPQVDGEPGHAQEHNKEQSHDGENRSPLLAESPDRAQLPIAYIERASRGECRPKAAHPSPSSKD